MLCESAIGLFAWLLAAEYQKRYRRSHETRPELHARDTRRTGRTERLSAGGVIVSGRAERPS